MYWRIKLFKQFQSIKTAFWIFSLEKQKSQPELSVAMWIRSFNHLLLLFIFFMARCVQLMLGNAY